MRRSLLLCRLFWLMTGSIQVFCQCVTIKSFYNKIVNSFILKIVLLFICITVFNNDLSFGQIIGEDEVCLGGSSEPYKYYIEMDYGCGVTDIAWTITGGDPAADYDESSKIIYVNWDENNSTKSISATYFYSCGGTISHDNEAYMDVYTESVLSGTLSTLTVKDTSDTEPASLPMCENYTLNTNVITDELGPTVYYRWYYKNGGGWNLIKTTTANETKIQLDNLVLDPGYKIYFKVAAWSVCGSNKEEIETQKYPLKYCFNDYDITDSVTNLTCYYSDNATIIIDNIHDPKDCETFEQGDSDSLIFTASRFVHAQLKEDANEDSEYKSDYTCSETGANPNATPQTIEGVEGFFCPAGFANNVKVPYAPKIILDQDFELQIDDNNTVGIDHGIYEITLEHDLFSPYKFFTDYITAPDTLFFNGATPDEQYGYYHVSAPNANDGRVELSIEGETDDYYYYMDEEETKTTLTLQDGKYYVSGLDDQPHSIKIVDDNDCKSSPESYSIGLTSPESLSVTETENVSVSCHTDDDGSDDDGAINFKIENGIGPYYAELLNQFKNNVEHEKNVSNNNEQYFGNLEKGTYYLAVRDNNPTDGKSNEDPYQVDTIEIYIDGPGNPIQISVDDSKPPACIGGETGSLTLSGSGGTGLYDFYLDGVPKDEDEESLTINGLSADTYSVKLRDEIECFKTMNNIIVPVNPDTVYISSIVPIDVECYGDSTGQLIVTATSGQNDNGYKFYVVSGDANGTELDFDTITAYSDDTITNLSMGTYSVFVEDDNNCLHDGFANKNAYKEIKQVGQNSSISLSTELTAIATKGDSTGEIRPTISGGAGKYEWKLFNSDSVEISSDIAYDDVKFSIENLPADTYRLFVKDTCNCPYQEDSWWTNEIIIREPTHPLEIVLDSVFHPLCHGDSTGKIWVHGFGGWEEYTYDLYKDNQFIETNDNGYFEHLPEGTYKIVVRDTMQVADLLYTKIEAPKLLTLDSAIVDPVKCFGESTGTVTLSLSGGTGSYYTWDNEYEDTLQSVVVDQLFVVPGEDSTQYTIYFMDDNGCQGDTMLWLTQSPQVTFDFERTVAQTAVKNGSIEVEVGGGKEPYSYVWNKKNSTEILSSGSFVSNIGAGEYELHFTDGYDCKHNIDTLTLDDKPGPELEIVEYKKPTCNDYSDGYIHFTAHEGNPNYDVALLQDTAIQNLSNLDSAMVYQFSSLTAGNYQLAISDSWNWTGLDTISQTLDEVPELALNYLDTTHITQYGIPDGKIEFEIMGGNDDYEYFLFDSLRMDTVQRAKTGGKDSILNLSEGFYTLFYRDTCGCTNFLGDWITKDSIRIIEPDSLYFVVDSVKQPSCYGDTNGIVFLHGEGGWNLKDGYDFRIDSSDWTKDTFFEYLRAGDYYIEIKDDKGVTHGEWVTVTQPDPFMLDNVVINDVLCYGNATGSIDLAMQGGTYPYIIETNSHITNETDTVWQENNVISGLSAGDYSISLQDIRGCSIEPFDKKITQPPLLEDTVLKWEAQVDSSNGSMQVLIEGGVSPYEILWMQGADTISTSDSVVGLPTGEYDLFITDEHGCGLNHKVFLPVKGGPKTHNLEITPLTCNNYNDGIIDFELVDGHPPYSFRLFNHEDSTVKTFVNVPDSTHYSIADLEPGNYTFVVEDSWGWLGKEFNNVVEEPVPISIKVDVTDVTITGEQTGEADISISGGNLIYEYRFENVNTGEIISSGECGNKLHFDQLFAGQYKLYLKDTCGCTNGYTGWIEKSANIREPKPLQLMVEKVRPPKCNGYNDGSIKVISDGGGREYMYYINGGDPTSIGIFNELSAGKYYIEVYDEFGAHAGDSLNLDDPGVLEISALDITTDHCVAENTTSVNINVTGGTQPYYYSLDGDPWKTGTHISGLTYGNYSVSVRDTNECYGGSEQFQVEQTELLNVEFTKQTAQLGHNNGSIEANIEGGQQPYFISWKNSSGTILSADELLDSVSTGAYYFNVTDVNGCSFSHMVILDAKYGPRMNSTSTVQETCKGMADGSAAFTIRDGNKPYTIDIYKQGTFITSVNAENTIDTCTLFNLEAGDYTLEIKDQLGWTGRGSLTIYSPEVIQLTLDEIQIPSCFGYDDASLAVSALGGNGGYKYNWNTGDQTSQIVDLSAGSYSLTVTDQFGCEDTASYTVENPELLVVDLGPDIEICTGQEYFLTSNEYTSYRWYFDGDEISTLQHAEVEEEGLYELYVTNQNGCQASDDIYVTIRSDLLVADFLMPSEAYTIDTVMVIDISWPEPENVYWTFDEGIHSIYSEDYMEQIVFDESGIFRVSIISTKGACIDSVSKYINVKSAEQEMLKNSQLGAKKPMIKTFDVYPNPNTGEFNVKVELREISDVELVLIRMDNQQIINRQKAKGYENYLFEFNLGFLRPGIHVLRLEVQNEVKTKKMLIAN